MFLGLPEDVIVTTKDRIIQLLRERTEEMRERFSVRRIGLFGSYARDNAAPGSDIDLLVEFEEPTYDHYMDLKFCLEDLFGVEADLVIADSVKPRLKPYIAREAICA
ncbi:MAG: nucleotidyltransferase family protein [Candidatus Abyssubacteria bacterium]